MEPQQLIMAHDVAAMLGIDRTTVSRWRRSGRLKPALKLSGKYGAYLFDRKEVELLAAESGVSA